MLDKQTALFFALLQGQTWLSGASWQFCWWAWQAMKPFVEP
jgi:hypothetical protein